MLHGEQVSIAEPCPNFLVVSCEKYKLCDGVRNTCAMHHDIALHARALHAGVVSIGARRRLTRRQTIAGVLCSKVVSIDTSASRKPSCEKARSRDFCGFSNASGGGSFAAMSN